MPTYRIDLLDKFSIGKLAIKPNSRLGWIVAYVTLSPKYSCLRAHLAEALWPQLSPSNRQNNLRQGLREIDLRFPELLVADRTSIKLNRSVARTKVLPVPLDPSRLLPGWRAVWLDEFREKLRIENREHLLHEINASPSNDSAISAANTAIQFDPYQEEFVSAKVYALLKEGRLSEAETTFFKYSNALRLSTGENPSPELLRLARALDGKTSPIQTAGLSSAQSLALAVALAPLHLQSGELYPSIRRLQLALLEASPDSEEIGKAQCWLVRLYHATGQPTPVQPFANEVSKSATLPTWLKHLIQAYAAVSQGEFGRCRHESELGLLVCPPDDFEGMAELHSLLCTALYQLDLIDLGLEVAKKGLAFVQNGASPFLKAVLEANLASCLLKLDLHEELDSLLGGHLPECERFEFNLVRILSLCTYGDALTKRKDRAVALEQYRKAEFLAGHSDNLLLRAHSVEKLGLELAANGYHQESIQTLMRAVKLHSGIGNRTALASCYLGIGKAEYGLRNVHSALEAFAQAARVYADLSEPGLLANIVMWQARAYRRLGKSDFALNLALRADATLNRCDTNRLENQFAVRFMDEASRKKFIQACTAATKRSSDHELPLSATI